MGGRRVMVEVVYDVCVWCECVVVGGVNRVGDRVPVT